MAKRFTDSEKWKRPWFRSLSLKQKLIWIYLCDDCDHAGIWLGDFDLMSFQLGFSVTEKDLNAAFEQKITKYGNKFLINDFFEFQYGKNIEGIKAKKKALDRIKELKSQPTINPCERVEQGLDDPLSISISISTSNKGGVGEKKLEEIYAVYPKKLGKKRGMAKLKTILKNEKDVENMKISINNYISHLKKNGTENKFIKQFDTFLGSWEDWLDPEAGTGESFKSVGGLSRDDWAEIHAEARK